MRPRPARTRVTGPGVFVQYGRPGCATVEEETPPAFVYHCEPQQLEPRWKYLCIISDQVNAAVKPDWRNIDHDHLHLDSWRNMERTAAKRDGAEWIMTPTAQRQPRHFREL
ncbi:hypothetical protein EYF80_025674 [Liparis tanakae]|uniref:Uncharacterized protein n=1 Tax=Liparis tanakae TaxID=230148 RepID=A0A4Z2HEN7_9TELE|nr:hypothetical protein EYF80_025674 [Liparis tanakae]